MKQWFRSHLGLWVLTLAAVIVAGAMLAPRMRAENANKTYDIIIDYEDFRVMSQQSEHDIQWWMSYLRSLGLEKVALFESTLDSLGRDPLVPIDVWQLSSLRKTAGWTESLPQEIVDCALASGSNYDAVIACYEPEAADWILSNLTARLDGFDYTEAEQDGTRYLYLPSSGERDLRMLPLGFWPGIVELLQEAGLTILPRTTTVEGFNTLRFQQAVLESFETLNPAPGYFFGGGDGLPGYDEPEEAHAGMLAYLTENEIYPLATERADQYGNLTWPGFNEIIEETGYSTVRMFNEWDYIQWRYAYYSYGSSEEIVNSFYRAVVERNCRVIYLRAILETDEEEQYIVDSAPYELMVRQTVERLAERGFQLGTVKPMEEVEQPFALRLLLGIGAVAAAVLMLCAVYPIRRRWQWLLVALGSLCVLGAMLTLGETAKLLLNMGAGIVYPALTMLVLLRALRDQTPVNSSWCILGYCIGGMLLCVLGALCGALVSTAAISESAYMLEFRLYRGVKLMQIVPIGLYMLGYCWLLLPRELGLQQKLAQIGGRQRLRVWLKSGLEQPIKLRWVLWAVLTVAGLGCAGVVGLYYISRTGNATSSISSLELMFRNVLEQHLLARPRTKEFLIGVPCLMWFIWLSCHRYRLLPFFVGLGMAVGLTSFVNTFLHLRAPLYLSFARTGYAVLFGLIIGMVGIALLELLRGLYRRRRAKRV